MVGGWGGMGGLGELGIRITGLLVLECDGKTVMP